MTFLACELAEKLLYFISEVFIMSQKLSDRLTVIYLRIINNYFFQEMRKKLHDVLKNDYVIFK